MNEAKSTRLIDYLEHIVQAIERIRDYKEILAMLGELTPLEQTRAYREIVAKNQPIWRHEGEAQLVLRLLHRRLGTLTDQQQARVQALPVEQLEDLGEALLDFAGGADLDDWLNGWAKQPKAV